MHEKNDYSRMIDGIIESYAQIKDLQSLITEFLTLINGLYDKNPELMKKLSLLLFYKFYYALLLVFSHILS